MGVQGRGARGRVALLCIVMLPGRLILRGLGTLGVEFLQPETPLGRAAGTWSPGDEQGFMIMLPQYLQT